MEVLDFAANCSVNNKEKKKEQQTFTCSPDFLAAQHLTEVKKCDGVTGGNCMTFHEFLLNFLNK